MNRLFILTGATGEIGSAILSFLFEEDAVCCLSRRVIDSVINIRADFSSSDNSYIDELKHWIECYEPISEIVLILAVSIITPIEAIGSINDSIDDNIRVNVTSQAMIVDAVVGMAKKKNADVRIIQFDSRATCRPIKRWVFSCSSKAYMCMFLGVLAGENFTEYGVKALINNKSIIEICTSKYKTAKFLQSYGIDAPLTYHAMEYSTGLNYSFIMKSDNGCGSKHLKIICSELEWLVADKDGIICQQMIGNSDKEYTVGVFSDGNNLNSIVLKLQLKYGGVSVLVKCCDIHEIDMIAEKTTKVFWLKGSFHIQLKQDGEKYYILEINPRLSSTTGFRHKFGFQDAVWWFDLVDGKLIPRYKNSCVGSGGVKVLDDVVISFPGGYWKSRIIQYSGYGCQVMVA